MQERSGDPEGIRTPVAAVKGRCLDHLTTGPCEHTRVKNGRGEGIRTPGPMLPKHVRYQTALHPVSGCGFVLLFLSSTCHIVAYSHSKVNPFFKFFSPFCPSLFQLFFLFFFPRFQYQKNLNFTIIFYWFVFSRFYHLYTTFYKQVFHNFCRNIRQPSLNRHLDQLPKELNHKWIMFRWDAASTSAAVSYT